LILAGTGCQTALDLGPHPLASACNDSSPTSGQFTMQYESRELIVSTTKTYILQSNWSQLWMGQSETYNGLSFTVHNPQNAAVDATHLTPMGFPSIFIGQFGTYKHASKESHLPIRVSAISSAPTIFTTNSQMIGHSNYSAGYEVWFTQTGDALDGGQTNPGTGGAFLLIWLFQPTDRQPHGSDTHPAMTVAGIDGTWNVWVENDGIPSVSYVRTTPIEGMSFDLNDFVKDAVQNHYAGVTNAMYVSVVFGGFAIWGGADGIELKQFCLEVN
jgi:hypothetical protein